MKHLRNIILFLVIILIPVEVLAFEPSLEDLPASYLQSKNILSNRPSHSEAKQLMRPQDATNYQTDEEATRAFALDLILKVAATCNKNEASAKLGFVAKNANFERKARTRDEAVSGIDTARSDERFAAEICILQQKPSFAEASNTIAEEKKVTKKKLFSDVSKKDWFYDAVAEAKQKGIVKGYKKGKKRYFKPNEGINLAEALRILFASTKMQNEISETPLLASLPADSWYGKDISYAVSRTILSQQQNGATFPPNETLTQKELVLLLYRFLKTREGSNFGYASWYGDGLAKTKLEKNTEYRKRSLTAAHKTLPFGSVVRVTNMRNGKSVDVVINDRGPYVTGRIIDLSKTAFSQLAEPSTGVVSVEIEIINSKNQEPNSKQESNNQNF